MKKHSKSQMYSKMYLITPMVYEKIEKHLDKNDKMSLTNINKPYFTPKFEFHSSQSSQQPPYIPPSPPSPPTYPKQEPKHEENPDVEQQPYEEQMFEQQPPEQEMEWQEQGPFMREMETQTDPILKKVVPVFSTSTQTKNIPTHEIETQTYQPRGHEIETQTEPVAEASQKKRKPKRKKVVPTEQQETFSQSNIPSTQRGMQIIQPNIPPIQRSMPIIEEISSTPIPETEQAVGSVLPQLSLQYHPQHDIMHGQARNLSNIPKKTVSILRRTPIRITLPRELRTAQELHREHYGLPVQGRQLAGSGSIPQLTYITEQPRSITHQEFPVAIPQTSTVAIPESSYYVETTANTPPGQKATKRGHGSDTEIVPEHLIFKQYKKKTKRKPKLTQQQVIPDVSVQGTEGIDLPKSENRPKYQCSICGTFLSSKYNLKRHQQREWLRLNKIGKDVPVEEQPEYLEWLRAQEEQQMEQEPQPSTSSGATQQFESWTKFPAKRTSTDAKFKPQSYRKRVAATRNPESQISFSQWENPETKPKGSSRANLSKGKRAVSPPPQQQDD
jgi:hypothetical protein